MCNGNAKTVLLFFYIISGNTFVIEVIFCGRCYHFTLLCILLKIIDWFHFIYSGFIIYGFYFTKRNLAIYFEYLKRKKIQKLHVKKLDYKSKCLTIYSLFFTLWDNIRNSEFFLFFLFSFWVLLVTRGPVFTSDRTVKVSIWLHCIVKINLKFSLDLYLFNNIWVFFFLWWKSI